MTEPLSLKEFIEDLKKIYEEVGGDGITKISNHDIPPILTLIDHNDDHYDVIDISVDRIIGCGCWRGAEIHIRKRKN